ncbi:GNAT family N-acetyltransferase [Novosphingobium album (ex Hu et al. 2023)]|uniref:GNAT family N-acetyltransferase n=1 Tax=Novosphingobium album (ex Hu et al. 2023) TaxID=2930093 RepID=UPI003AF29233
MWSAAREACRAAGHRGPFTVSAAPDAVGWYETIGFRAQGPATDEGGMIRIPMQID